MLLKCDQSFIFEAVMLCATTHCIAKMRLSINQMLDPQKVPHTSPVSELWDAFCEYFWTMDRIITAVYTDSIILVVYTTYVPYLDILHWCQEIRTWYRHDNSKPYGHSYRGEMGLVCYFSKIKTKVWSFPTPEYLSLTHESMLTIDELCCQDVPDSKVHGANMGPTC